MRATPKLQAQMVRDRPARMRYDAAQNARHKLEPASWMDKVYLG